MNIQKWKNALRAASAFFLVGAALSGCAHAPRMAPHIPPHMAPHIAPHVALAEAPKERPNFAPSRGSMLSVFTDIDETDALLFLGTRHTFDADDAQIFDIERLLTLFQPSIILIEGGEWTEIGATKKVVTAAGEMAFVVQLARLRRIKSESFEPSINDEVLYVLEKHTALDAKLYYALRMATQWSKQAPSLEIDSRMDRLLGIEDLAAMPQLNIAPLNTAQLSVVMTHKFPSVLDWKNLDIWKNGLPVDTDGTDTLDQIRKRSEEFRNKRLLSRIQAHRKAGGKVLVVAGVNHLIALMPFLRGG